MSGADHLAGKTAGIVGDKGHDAVRPSLWGCVMKKLLLAAAALVTFATPLHAFYTECTVTKDIETMDRPHGITMGRWSPLKKGGKVAVRDTYQDWVFVLHFSDDGHEEYGWVPRNVLDNCKSQEGTP